MSAVVCASGIQDLHHLLRDHLGEITARERDVLVALCRPLRTGDPFAQPASIRLIAKELETTMGLCGVNTIAEIDDGVIAV